MQNPVEYWEQKLKGKFIGNDLRNVIREYLQVMALKIIYQSKEGTKLGFGGGTALRICYNLPRYSEDLDFELIGENFDLNNFLSDFKNGFSKFNTDTDIRIPIKSFDKIVIKFWLKFSNLLQPLGLTPHKSEKFFIKMEIYTTPPKSVIYEPVYVSKFDEYFPVLTGNLETLFANKTCAIFERKYLAPRDYYDLLWYLNKGIEPNYKVLKELSIKIKNKEELIKSMKQKVNEVGKIELINTIGRFLDNKAELNVLKDFTKVFESSAKKYLIMKL